MELYFKTRKEWQRWLEKNHSTVDSLWIIFYKKHTGKPCLLYVDAVEEALCYGWIDGKIKRIYIEWLNSAKRAETRPGRIEKIVKLAEQNIRPGMM